MTRNNITKAKIIIINRQQKDFSITEKINANEAKKGAGYAICYDGCWFCYSPATGELMDFSRGNHYTHFGTFYEAKSFINNNREAFKNAIGKIYQPLCRHHHYKFKFDKNKIKIIGDFNYYFDTTTGKKYYSRQEVEKLSKNLLFVEKSYYSEAGEAIYHKIRISESFFTSSKEENSILFEFYQIQYDEDNIPHVIPHKYNKAFRIYNNGKAFYCQYNDKKHQYIDDTRINKNDNEFNRRYSYSGNYYSDGYIRSVDATERCIHEDGSTPTFTQTTMNIIKELGIPEYYFNRQWNQPYHVNDYRDLLQSFIRSTYDVGYDSSEPQILQDVADFLRDIPFDEERSVVKFRNGYILRLGTIRQIYEREDGKLINEKQDGFNLVHEEYYEFARLFISNTFSTRSLSIYADNKWQHRGIHLIGDLFQGNPPETHLDVDVEARNRAALEQIYTVHPKLKYMKKYMELHPDILYSSCVPFLRALFQYNVILETFIALKKDDIFWTPVNNDGSHYYYYNPYGFNRKRKYLEEKFSMENFIDIMGLREIPQKGDFYQRLGLTKQQFKLIFENTERWSSIAKVVFDISWTLPNDNLSFCRNRSNQYIINQFKRISYEEFRMVVEIINNMLDKNYSLYSLSSDINRLNQYYKGIKRVYKALITKGYDPTLLMDYLRMRAQLEENQFPDFHTSIWDMFPDNNDELNRYHDRIEFLYNEFSLCRELKDAISGSWSSLTYFSKPGTTESYNLQDIYYHCKNSEISVEEVLNLIRTSNKIVKYSDHMILMKELCPCLPNSITELEAKKQEIEHKLLLFTTLYHMYWGDIATTRYRDINTRNEKYNNWGGKTYTEFVLDQLSNNLDKSKYDLYLRLRDKFKNNLTDFHIENYPIQIQDEETLDRVYQELSSQETDLNELIAQREREYRQRIQEANEEKTAGAQKKYAERYPKLKYLNYDNGSGLCIIVPKNLVSLIVEGQTLHHCVGSFVDSVSEGKDTIVFLRKADDNEAPYVTISLLMNGKSWFIDQAHGDHNSDISDEDVKFLKEWAAAKGILESSVKKSYGAHRHH